MISVCMATYNGERFIRRQLETILAQLASEDEVVVSDDSSTDGTLAIINDFADERIRLLSGQTFHSPTYNFENALKHSRGEIIMLADQDDEWLPDRISTVIEALEQRSLVVCDAEVIDSNGDVTEASLRRFYGPRTGLISNLVRNRYVGCCMAFRREVLDVALPFPAKLPWHDWWIGLICEAFFSTSLINQTLIRYRRHDSNISNTGGRSTLAWTTRIAHRWNIGIALAVRGLVIRQLKSP
jgi:glycosyltransferase involved in cell wall biosynthesis